MSQLDFQICLGPSLEELNIWATYCITISIYIGYTSQRILHQIKPVVVNLVSAVGIIALLLLQVLSYLSIIGLLCTGAY